MATIEDYRDEFDPGNVHTISVDPLVTIAAQVGGGGGPGEAYAGWWFYELRVDGEVLASDNDFSTGTPLTSEVVAAKVIQHLCDRVQDDTLADGPEEALNFAEGALDELSIWAAEHDGEPR